MRGKKRKPLRAFFFLLLVTLFSGPGHAGHGQHRRHRVDADARVEGLGAAGLGIILGSRGGGVVIVPRWSGLLFSRTHSISTIIILIKFAAIRRNHCTSDTTQTAVSCGILQGHRLAAVDFHRLLALKDNFLTVEVDSNIIAYSHIIRKRLAAHQFDSSALTSRGNGSTQISIQLSMEKLMDIQMISYDKVNQLRHVLFLQDKAHTLALMQKHAAILRPKFRCVLRCLEQEIAPLGIAAWQKPTGGYFVSVNTLPGLAKRTLALCKEAGVTMTGAGATFPYGVDPQDSNIRIAPSLPPVEELEKAMEVFCVCLRMAALEQLLQE